MSLCIDQWNSFQLESEAYGIKMKASLPGLLRSAFIKLMFLDVGVLPGVKQNQRILCLSSDHKNPSQTIIKACSRPDACKCMQRRLHIVRKACRRRRPLVIIMNIPVLEALTLYFEESRYHLPVEFSNVETFFALIQ